jgi:hypothetical protein
MVGEDSDISVAFGKKCTAVLEDNCGFEEDFVDLFDHKV